MVTLAFPTRVLDLMASSQQFQYVTTLVSLPDGGAILVDKSETEQRVVRVDEKGKLRGPVYTCTDESLVKDLIVTTKYIYIIHYSGIVTKCMIKNLSEVIKSFNMEATSVSSGALSAANELIFCEYSGGGIFKYNLKTLQKEQILSGLNKPISVAYYKNRLAVCEYWGNCVNLYDSEFNQLSTIGGVRGDGDGELYSPTYVTFSSTGTLLIADKENDRVCEFRQHGGFIRHVITARDGIKEPTSLSYTCPYIWVTCNYGKNVKRFKIYE